MSTKNEKYSAAERRAYYRGQGYAIAKAGGKVNCTTDKTKKSFLNGCNAGKVGKGAKH